MEKPDQQNDLSNSTIPEKSVDYKDNINAWSFVNNSNCNERIAANVPDRCSEDIKAETKIPSKFGASVKNVNSIESTLNYPNDSKSIELQLEISKKSFIKASEFKNHGNISHSSDKLFSCDSCGKTFQRKKNLLGHYFVHRSDTPFICNFCGKKFKRKCYLIRHALSHTGGKTFSCSVCGKMISRVDNLNKHLLTHTGEKPFSCSICGKTFSRSDHLNKHLLTHTGEKPYTCSVCGKNFTQGHRLKSHFIVHTGEKPLSDSLCGKKFSSTGHLKQRL